MRYAMLIMILCLVPASGFCGAGEILITGESALTKGELIEAAGVFSDTTRSDDELAAAAGRVVELYRSRGYWNAAARFASEGGTLILRVSEGEPVKVGKIRFQGEMQIGEDDLIRNFPLMEGDLFDSRRVEFALERMVQFLNSRGFVNASVKPVEFSLDRNIVGFSVRVTEGAVFSVRDVTFPVRSAGRKAFLRREFGMRRGEPFSYAGLRTAEERFSRNAAYVQTGPAAASLAADGPYVDILVPVEEKKAGSFTGGMAFQRAGSRPGGYMNLYLANIAGTGRKLKLGWMGNSSAGSQLSLDYLEPWIGGLPLSGRGSFAENSIGQEFSRMGVTLGLESAFSRRVKLGILIQKEKTVLGESTGRRNDATSVVSEAVVDGRDSADSPRSGGRASLSFSLSEKRETGDMKPLQDRWQMKRIDSSLEYDIRLGSKLVGVSRLRYLSVSSNGPLLIYDYPSVGGAMSLRGYREDQFRVGGGVLGSFELRFYGRKNGARSFLFVDTGRMTREPDGNLVTALGYGAGIRESSRAGTIGLDLGFENGRPFSEGKIHLTIQQEF